METRFWLENIDDLFHSCRVVPIPDDSFQDQMNSLTRLVLLVSIVYWLFSKHFNPYWTLALIILIILVYYVVISCTKTTLVKKEYYGPVETVLEPVPPVPWNTGTNDFVFSSGQDNARCRCSSTPPQTTASITLPKYVSNPQLVDTGQSLSWCPQDKPFQDSVSTNQVLVGPPNPKTLVAPVIPNPICDFEAWRPNDFVFPRNINDQRRQEMFDNGYVVLQNVQKRTPILREDYSAESPYRSFRYPTVEDNACGYDPSNLQYNLPINYQADACQKTPKMADYNRDLFTIPLQPGVYTTSQVNQPDASQSNLGISMTQSFLPTTYQNAGGSHNRYALFTEMASSDGSQEEYTDAEADAIARREPLRNEIYDPRLTGYGTSYRSYYEPVTGQTRFYYDDIDQHTQYNYLTRNKIDFTGFGTSVGSVKPSLQGDAVRHMSDKTFTDSTVAFRTELQQRLMHKNSNREWQRRIAPIVTNRTA